MRSLMLRVNGMHSDHCAAHVAESLKQTRGVHEVEVDVMSHTARVEHDERLCHARDLIEAVQRAGFQVDTLGLC